MQTTYPKFKIEDGKEYAVFVVQSVQPIFMTILMEVDGKEDAMAYLYAFELADANRDCTEDLDYKASPWSVECPIEADPHTLPYDYDPHPIAMRKVSPSEAAAWLKRTYHRRNKRPLGMSYKTRGKQLEPLQDAKGLGDYLDRALYGEES